MVKYVYMENVFTAKEMRQYVLIIMAKLKELLYYTWTNNSRSTNLLGVAHILLRKWNGKKIMIFVSKYYKKMDHHGKMF